MNKSLKNGITSIFIVNIINLIFSLIINFVMPKYLSIDSFASIKLYQLYVSFMGVLHLGFVDGLYLKYGGKFLQKEKNNEIISEFSTFRTFQIVITILLFLIALISKNNMMLILAISIFPYNMLGAFNILFQAVGEFKIYSISNGLNSFLMFVVNIILIFTVDNKFYMPFLVGYFFIYLILWFYLELYFYNNIGRTKKWFTFNKSILTKNIYNGILLMLGNLSSILLTSLDRWFVQFLMPNRVFALYGFAVSVQNFMNFAITPITTTLYNYFCQVRTDFELNKIKRIIIIFSSLIISFAFCAKFILEFYLIKYIDSTQIIFLLFGAQFFFIIIRSIFINLYKSTKNQKIYFIKLCLIIVFSVLINFLLFFILRTKESFAIGTFLSSLLWLYISQSDFKKLRMTVTENIYIYFVITIFFFNGFYLNSILGFILYILSICVLSFILMKAEFKYLYDTVKSLIVKRLF